MVRIRKSDTAIQREAEKNGFVASMTVITNKDITEHAKDLGLHFRKNLPRYSGTYDEEESEEVLYECNKLLKKQKVDAPIIDFPLSGGSNIHLLQITKNLQLILIVVDEYYGDGEYSKYTDLSSFIINETTDVEDVDQLIDFAKKLESLNM